MNDQQIQELINQFDTEKLKENAYFGIFDEAEYSYIKANKEGLLLYAMNLIVASKNIDSITNESKDKTVPFERFANWIDEDSPIVIDYI